jgi:hypothetical protein
MEILAAIRNSVPRANERSPGEVLRYVEAAVRQYSAKVIEPIDIR